MFVCYAHHDSESVYSDLIELDQNGIQIWYDEGIPAGSSWRAEIATAIKGAKILLFFISTASLQSTHCLREVDFALNNDIDIVPVYLDDSILPGELELVLNRVHALFRETDSMYMDHLVGALKGGAGFSPSRSLARKRTPRIVFPALTILLGLSLLILWTQWDSIPTDVKINPIPTGAPNAYDQYLEGLPLLERWDKDDNLDMAIRLFREATIRDPDFALAFARLADALRIRYALTGDSNWLDEATNSVNEAMRLNADLAPVHVALGRIYAMRGNIDLAFAALNRAVSIDPNDAVANQVMASIYARLGRLQDADASFQKAIALNPKSTSIHDAYAKFLSGQSRFEDALREWQTVIRLAPDNYAVMVNLGFVFSETDKFAEAITMYKRANEIRPTYMAYSNLGTAYSRSKRFPDAIDAYQRALEIDATDWLAWGNLAYVYSWVNGMDQQATETFEKAIQLAEDAQTQNPRDPFVNSDLSLYYAKTGQTVLALQHLETAITLSPESGEILAAAAEACEVIGQRDRAIELVQRSLELGFTRRQLQRNPELGDLLTDPRMQELP